MAEKLADLFGKAQAPTVTWRGQLVYSMFQLPSLAAGTAVRIVFDDPNPARPQGLRLKARHGALRIAAQDLDDVVLWSDSAPRTVEAQIRSRTGDVNLRIWNCWRDPIDTTQAWIGNAGMLVESTESGFLLRCSDGFDDVTFDDLVAVVGLSQPTDW